MLANIYAPQLERFGRARVAQVEELLGTPPSDLPHVRTRDLLGLASRETNLQNIVGGGYYDEKHTWVRTGVDRGYWQISSEYHADWLKAHVGCHSGSDLPDWEHRAVETGYVPTLADAAQFTISELYAAMRYAKDNGVKGDDDYMRRFSLATHNAGPSGALAGYKAGNVDLHTTHGDYSADVVQRALWAYRWLASSH